MEAPVSLAAIRPGSRNPTYNYSREPMSSSDKKMIMLTASLLGLLLFGVLLLFFIPWARKRFTLQPQALGMKPVPPAISKRQLQALPCTLFLTPADVELSLHAASASDCAICLAGFANGDRLRVLPPCHHIFHVGCIDTWLLQQSSCPICRESLLQASSSTPDPYKGWFHTVAKLVSL